MSTVNTNTSSFSFDGALQWTSKNKANSIAQNIVAQASVFTDLTSCNIISFKNSKNQLEIEIIQNNIQAFFSAYNISSIDVINPLSFEIKSKDASPISLTFVSQIEMESGYAKCENIINNIEVLPC